MLAKSFLSRARCAELTLFLVIAVATSGCSELECPDGLIKVGKLCKRPDAGATLDGEAEPTLEAGVDPAAASDAAGGATGDASSGGDAASSMDGAASSDAASQGSDAGASSEAGVQLDAASNLDAGVSPPADSGSDATTACTAGYLLKNGACQDVDECFEGTHQCHMTSTCKNSPGGYDCECPLGYSGGTSAGFACAPRIAVGGEWKARMRLAP